MSILAPHFIRLGLIDKRNEIEYQMMKLNKKLSDLQSYSSCTGDGTFSMQNLLNIPSSIFNRAVAFMNYSHNGAIRDANYNMQMMGPQLQMQMQQLMQTNSNPQAIENYKRWIFNNMYKQGLEKYQQQETKLLNQQEKQIQKELASLSTQKELIEKRIQNAEKMEQSSVQRLSA